MIVHCKNNLLEIRQLLTAVNSEQYNHKSSYLSGATIGQHIRHILEFYICLINGGKSVNYDKRKRDLKLEMDPEYALETIDWICSNLVPHPNSDFFLEGNFSDKPGEIQRIQTSFNRELAYCLEHSIHHQALIKIGLLEMGIAHVIKGDFGVAPATIRYKENAN